MKPRSLIIKVDHALVPLTKGMVAVVDLEDVEVIGLNSWYFDGVYARRKISIEGKQFNVLMHRVINKTPDTLETDHIDGNGLNNKRSNLRHATGSQNNQNRKKITCGTSKYKGVSFHTGSKKWRAQINEKHIGSFRSELECAKAYDKAALKLFGEYARLNF